MIQRSSVVERSAVNRLVVGSNPTAGAKFLVMNFSVYVLQNADGKFYIGMSEDIEHRVQQHNIGQSKWTKGKGPWRAIWTSEALSFSDARRLENKLKSQKGGDGFYKMTGLSRKSGCNPAAAGS